MKDTDKGTHILPNVEFPSALPREVLETIAEGPREKEKVTVHPFAADHLQEEAPQKILKYVNILRLDVRATTEMDYLFLHRMQKEGKGTIVNIATTAGESVHAASKTHRLSRGQALYKVINPP